MSNQKIAVVESEKSFKICSTNWKEDLMLQRNLQVLDRSENTVVNRITVDQKILLRRFQTKLGRSKMSYARALGNMQLQKKLRDNTTFVLNTNIGHNDGQDETLKKLWDSGRKEYESRISSDSFLRKKKVGTFTCIEDSESDSTPIQDHVETRPYTASNLRPHTAVFLDLSSTTRKVTSAPPQITAAPPQVTSSPPHVTEPETSPREPEVQLLDAAVEALEKEEANEADISKPTERKPRPQTARAFVQDETEFDVVQEKQRNRRRPSTAGGCLLSTAVKPHPRSSPVPVTGRRSARQAKPTPTGNAGLGSMFKDDSFEISLLDFQRFCVYSANYDMRVKMYGDKIKPLKSATTQSTDYYTVEVGESTQKGKTFTPMVAADEATPEDIKRATGNLTIRNLTLRNVEDRYRKLKTLPPITL